MLVFLDCEANGPCPTPEWWCTSFAAQCYERRGLCFFAEDITPAKEPEVYLRFGRWLDGLPQPPMVGISDNPAFDWQWINRGLYLHYGRNPMGWSCHRIGDFYAGHVGDFHKGQAWKHFRRPRNMRSSMDCVRGNIKAFERILDSVAIRSMDEAFH